LSGPARARTWTWTNISWENWKKLCSDATHPTELEKICKEECVYIYYY
jgi:hypothetical protein